MLASIPGCTGATPASARGLRRSAIDRDLQCPIRRVYLIEVLGQLRQTQPEHPLLATFLPYLVVDRERELNGTATQETRFYIGSIGPDAETFARLPAPARQAPHASVGN